MTGGCTQGGGGGIDPFCYIWFAMVVAVWFGRHVRGVLMWTQYGEEMLGPQATMDDTVIPANSRDGLEEEAGRVVESHQ